jgi:RNA recognition motif-containing protein
MRATLPVITDRIRFQRRCMMKIFVSNFGSSTDVARLAQLFLDYGDVEAVRIRKGQKRVYGIVEMSRESDGNEAIRDLDGKDWLGQRLEVKESTY